MTQLEEIPSIVKIILAIGLLIGVGIIYMLQLAETGIQMAECVAVTNESYTADNSSVTDLNFDLICTGSVVVFNNSDYSATYGATNYTLDLDAGTITWIGIHNGSAMGINYTHYDRTREEYQTLNSTATSLTNFSTNWLPLIVLAIAIGAIVVYLLREFIAKAK